MTPPNLRSNAPDAHSSNDAPPKRPSLTLVKRSTPREAPRHTPLALWHLLSLDAPSVATVWTIAVASSVGLHLPWSSPAAMFVAVWMLYAADRLLDARPLPGGQSPPELEERHRFHHRHRRAFLTLIAISACVLVALLRSLDPRAMRIYSLLATLLGAWFLIIHARPLPGDGTHRLPKELAVGIFFPAAVFIPTVARLPQLRLDLLPIALLLAATCSLNCLFLYAWEHPDHRVQAHSSTRWATNHLVTLTSSVAALSLLLILISPLLTASAQLHRGTTVLTSCILASSLLLLLLHHLRNRLHPLHLRALADLVLLTPLIPLALSFRA
ncbi:MAG TPA: hypothetical protein VN734_05335 [Acidobacteriaceae bacterium]|nr:hypothetical protein [Acidobacteriaceae bacterium]